MLDTEFDFYKKNQDELVKKYNGQFIVIIGEKVVDSLATFEEAFNVCQQKYEMGTFLIQECLPGKDSYTQTFHTRAIFA